MTLLKKTEYRTGRILINTHFTYMIQGDMNSTP